MTEIDRALTLDRRRLLGMGAGAALVTLVPIPASAAPADMLEAQKDLFGDRDITDGRVSLKLPPIAENGYSVALKIAVDSPMTDDDFVERIAVFSPRNPVSKIIQFQLGPRAGKAEIETRLRLAGSQTLTVIAEMNDGSLWRGTAQTEVTLAACVVL